MSQTSHTAQTAAVDPRSARIAQIERILTYLTIALAIGAAIYLAVTLFSDHEVCYGMQSTKLLCQPVDAVATERAALVMMYPAVLFFGGCAAGIWQTRAVEPSARSTAYGLLVTCALMLLGIILPAVTTSGFFFLPGTAALTAVAIVGTVKFVRDWRLGARAAS